jgi:hypothetical protein
VQNNGEYQIIDGINKRQVYETRIRVVKIDHNQAGYQETKEAQSNVKLAKNGRARRIDVFDRNEYHHCKKQKKQSVHLSRSMKQIEVES